MFSGWRGLLWDGVMGMDADLSHAETDKGGTEMQQVSAGPISVTGALVVDLAGL